MAAPSPSAPSARRASRIRDLSQAIPCPARTRSKAPAAGTGALRDPDRRSVTPRTRSRPVALSAPVTGRAVVAVADAGIDATFVDAVLDERRRQLLAGLPSATGLPRTTGLHSTTGLARRCFRRAAGDGNCLAGAPGRLAAAMQGRGDGREKQHGYDAGADEGGRVRGQHDTVSQADLGERD